MALTGTTGSGKTTVSNLLKNLGAEILSADVLARQVVQPGSPALSQIVSTFGPEFLLPSGELDRKRLGKLVFSDPLKRKRLEAITHPEIRAAAAKEAARILATKPKALIYDCPLLFEAGLDKAGFKKIIVVTAPEEICISRICIRDQISRADALARIQNQFPEVDKRSRADIVIENDGSLEALKQKVSGAFKALS